MTEKELHQYYYWFEPKKGRIEVADSVWPCGKCGELVPSHAFNVIFTQWVSDYDIEAINLSRFHNRKLPIRIERSIRMELLNTGKIGRSKSHRLKFMPELANKWGSYDEEADESRCDECCGTGPSDTSVNEVPTTLNRRGNNG